MDDEDEVLLALVDSLSNFLDNIGGNQHAVILFSPMEALCKSDESSVRDKVRITNHNLHMVQER